MDIASELSDLQHLIAAGKLKSARGKYRAIADRMQCSGEEEEQLVLEFLKAQILAGEEDYSAAIGIADRLLVRFRQLNLRERVARCHLLLSGLLLRTGDYRGARSHAEAAIYFCTWELDDEALRGDAHNDLGLALKDLGVWEEAERHFREAIDAYAGTGDGTRNLRVSLNLAILLRKMGKIAQASDMCIEGLKKSEELGVPIGVCRYGLELANISVIKRDPDEAAEYLSIARRAAETNGYKREKLLAIEIGGDLLDLKGDPAGALAVYETGLELSRGHAKGGDLEAEFLRRAAAVCLKLAKVEEGRSFVTDAIDLDDEADDAYEHGVCLRILGQLELAGGIGGCGVEHLEESVMALTSLSPWCSELATAELALGEALLGQNGDAEAGAAVEHLLSARRIYSNLGVETAVRALDDVIFASIGAGPIGLKKQMTRDGDVRTVSRHRLNPAQYGIVTEDERIVGDLARWGPTEARILVEGETGVGKELMARALHAMSRRREGAFVAVDCGALSETLADSELFGHARGAFTGAMKDRTGLIESANGGTLFLDEIGELSEVLQVKLLRVLEDGVVRRVGENVPRRIDVRVISATARDLWAEVEAGRFRRDLYYRLKTVLIRVPTLRERPYDIERLLDHYMGLYGEQHGVEIELGPDACKALTSYSWPGNVRELRNVAEALILSSNSGDVVDCERVAAFLTNGRPGGSLRKRVADLEHEEIERVLKVCRGNKTKAARMLGISRKTLWQRLKQNN